MRSIAPSTCASPACAARSRSTPPIPRRSARCAGSATCSFHRRAETMDLDFTGKVALITGAGNGIGRATALAFAGSGAKVVIVDRDAAAGEATAGIIRQQGGEARFVAADVTKSAEVQNYVKAALDAYGAIDCFLNHAGIEGKWAHTAEYDEDMFDAVIGVNVKGVFLGLRHVL